MELPEICPKCKNKDLCAEGFLCPAIEILADGNQSLKECYIDLAGDRASWPDYKEVLIAYQQAHRQTPEYTIERIRQVEDHKARLIVAARHAHLTIKEISDVLSVTPQAIYKYIKVYRLSADQLPDNTQESD